jgi:hypothetical protein
MKKNLISGILLAFTLCSTIGCKARSEISVAPAISDIVELVMSQKDTFPVRIYYPGQSFQKTPDDVGIVKMVQVFDKEKPLRTMQQVEQSLRDQTKLFHTPIVQVVSLIPPSGKTTGYQYTAYFLGSQAYYDGLRKKSKQ